MNDTKPDLAAGMQALAGTCARVETDLGLPSAFIFGLAREPDWTFIVKAGAIVEAALNQLLSAAVRDDRLQGMLSRLRLRGADSKLALAKDLDLLSTAERRFVERVASLRNAAVHDVHSFGLTFDSVLSGMQAQEQEQFWQDLLGIARSRPHPGPRPPAVRDAAKIIAWVALITFLGRLHSHKESLSFDRRHDQLVRQHDAEQAARFRELLDLVAPAARESLQAVAANRA